MDYDKELARRRLAEWSQWMTTFDLPDWDSLPQLELYMDQVIILLTQYLGPLARGQDEKAITASIINNYVRMKVMPPPVKKKYARVHLAYLIIICILKQNLSISSIQRLLPEDSSEESVHRLYADFVLQYRAAAAAFLRHVEKTDDSLLPDVNGSLITGAAILSNLSKDLTEYLLQEKQPEK